LKNVEINDVLVYAAHQYDRQHVLDLAFQGGESLEELDPSTADDQMIDQWTIDRDTAFEIGWDLHVVESIQNRCIEELRRNKRGQYRITSIRFPIKKETQDMIYLPVYTIDYQYRQRNCQCLINGRTGHVAGIREFSRYKVRTNIESARTLCVA
jgi:hypothetical protein